MKINKYHIGNRRNKLNQTRRDLESDQLKALHNLVPSDTIEELCRESQYDFRNRLLTPTVTIFHMLNTAISKEGSFQGAWQNIGQINQSDSLAKARKRLPLKVWQKFHRWSIKQIGTEFNELIQWRGHRVIGVDGTCVSMSDEPSLTQAFGKSGSKHGVSRFPIAQVVFIFMLNPLITLGHRIQAYRRSENTLFTELIKELHPGDVMVGDRRYAGAKRYVEYQRAHLEFITPAHQCLKIKSLKVIKPLGQNDLILELPISKAERRKDPTLPASIHVRAIKMKIKVQGKKKDVWIMTSLLDARRYPADEIKLWSKRRWKVEDLIREIKIWLGADVLRSKTEQGIYKELYARVIAFNLTHWLILKSSHKHHQNPERLSVSATLRLIVSYSLKMSSASKNMCRRFYEELLEKIASAKIRHRPGRTEPRMKKRYPKHYHILRISRMEWRKINGIPA